MTTAKMTVQDIVKESDEVKESGMDWKRVYYALHQSLESNKYRIMRCGDTLFWYRMDEPGVAQMYIFNADTDRALMRNFREFARAMHAAGFKTVYGDTHNVQMLRAISRQGFPMDIQPVANDEQGRQVYRGTVNV